MVATTQHSRSPNCYIDFSSPLSQCANTRRRCVHVLMETDTLYVGVPRSTSMNFETAKVCSRHQRCTIFNQLVSLTLLVVERSGTIPTYVVSSDGLWGDYFEGKWTGVTAKVINGSANTSTFGMTVTDIRLSEMDVLSGVLPSTGNCFLYTESASSTRFTFAWWRVYSPLLWFSLIGAGNVKLFFTDRRLKSLIMAIAIAGTGKMLFGKWLVRQNVIESSVPFNTPAGAAKAMIVGKNIMLTFSDSSAGYLRSHPAMMGVPESSMRTIQVEQQLLNHIRLDSRYVAYLDCKLCDGVKHMYEVSTGDSLSCVKDVTYPAGWQGMLLNRKVPKTLRRKLVRGFYKLMETGLLEGASGARHMELWKHPTFIRIRNTIEMYLPLCGLPISLACFVVEISFTALTVVAIQYCSYQTNLLNEAYL